MQQQIMALILIGYDQEKQVAIVYTMQYNEGVRVRFDWDELKAEINHKKHRVRFEEALTIFQDARSIEYFESNYGQSEFDSEDRFLRIGMSGKLNVLVVVFCERHLDLIRIISARHATKTERKIYEKGI